MAYKMNKSWEKERSEIHSPEGVDELKKNVKWGLLRLYTGIAESMWSYDFPEGFEEMQEMSWGTAPEYFMFNNGQAVWFFDDGSQQYHILPFCTTSKGINIYGKPVEWSPVPVGWTDSAIGNNPAVEHIRNLKLNSTNSVIMRNDLHGEGDRAYVESMVNEMVDNTLTLNQLQLIAKCPFVFNVTEDNVLSAKNYFLMLAENRPVIFTNALGDKTIPSVEPTNVPIDVALFDLFDRWESQLLTYLGVPNVAITKRAQQTVSEVQSNDSKLYIRRQEKLKQRQMAMDRLKEVFGVTVTVHSMIDELADEAMTEEKAQEDAQGDEHE
jgi:hypothetical protein